MMHTAVRFLHLQHPVQFITAFVQQVGDTVTAFRNVQLLRKHIRHHLIRIQQMSQCYRCCRHITPVIPGVMPATPQIHLTVGIIQIKRFLTMACFMLELPGIFFFQFHTAALEIKHPQRIPENRRIHVIRNGKLRTLIPVLIGKIILTFFVYTCKIDQRHLFAAVGILNRYIRITLQDYFSVCPVQRKFPATADRCVLHRTT